MSVDPQILGKLKGFATRNLIPKRDRTEGEPPYTVKDLLSEIEQFLREVQDHEELDTAVKSQTMQYYIAQIGYMDSCLMRVLDDDDHKANLRIDVNRFPALLKGALELVEQIGEQNTEQEVNDYEISLQIDRLLTYESVAMAYVRSLVSDIKDIQERGPSRGGGGAGLS